MVTNANWSEYWLNKGFTMFAQRRITNEVHGKALAALQAKSGEHALAKVVAELGAASDLTKLRCPTAEKMDPEYSHSLVPYEKGFICVAFLQSLVGEAAFDHWLAEYVEKFAFSSIVAEDMFGFFFAKFPQLQESVDVEGWLHSPGMPDWRPDHAAGQDFALHDATDIAKAQSGSR